MVMICDRLIEVGLIFVLIYTPLAFGAVTEYSTMLFEMAIGGLLLVWLIKIFLLRKKAPRDGSWQPGKHYLRFVIPPVSIPLCVFFIFLIFQRIPLPISLVKIISPNTYHLYAEAAGMTSVTVPQWLPLSVCAQSTETELLKFLTYVAVFFLIINNIRRPEQVKRLIYAIIAVGFSESLYGLLQLLSGKQFLSFYPKAFLISGSFINKNHFAGYMAMVILLTFGVIFTRFEKPRSSHQGDAEPIEEKYAKTSLSLFLVLIMISAHLLSGSRGGIVSLAGGIIFFAILVNIRHLLRRWIIVLLIFLPLVLVLMVMMVPDQISRNFSRFTGEQLDLSFRTRWEIWRTQGHIFQDFPAVGSGFGTLPNLARRYQTFRWTYRLAHSESDAMQLLAETGIIGVSVVALMGVCFFFRILAIWRQRCSRWAVAIVAGGLSAMFSLVMHSAVDFNLHIPSNALLFTVIAALSCTTVCMQRKKSRAAGRPGRRTALVLSPIISYSIMVSAFVLIAFYLFQIYRAYAGDMHYQNFTHVVAIEKKNPGTTHTDQIISEIHQAIHANRNHPEYAYALGSYLYQSSAKTLRTENPGEHRMQRFDEAEKWLRKAILLDPGNPWYYYEMGRLSHSRGDCLEQSVRDDDCLTARYYLAALKNYPKSLFLRKQIGGWFYHYDQEFGLQLIRDLLAADPDELAEHAKDTREFATFLYELGLDYESDREIEKSLHTKTELCKENVVLQTASANNALELGNDDGSGEWRVRFTSQDLRIGKHLCLPKNLTDYRFAALKILMNRVGDAVPDIMLSIDQHPIPVSQQMFPYVPEWQEIPFDIALLQGKSSLNVYIRTRTTTAENYFQIWGDQNTPTTLSVFNFQQTKDLSPDEGKQTGEYMIRLVLKK